MDRVLEKECHSTWTIWNPFDNRLDHHQYFPKLRLSVPSIAQKVSMIICPEGMERKRLSPFPAKSMQLSRWVRIRSRRRRHYITMTSIPLVDTFFKRLGHHLASLVLHDVDMNQEMLVGILKFTPNLKALTVSEVRIKGLTSWPDENCQFSPLPCLTYLKLGTILFWSYDRSFNAYIWLLNPYLDQLVGLSLDFSGVLVIKPNRLSSNNDAVYPKLEQLKIVSPNPSFLKNTKGFLNLKRLSIIHNVDDDFGFEEFEEFQMDKFALYDLTAFIDNFANTLEQLHLDIYWKILRKIRPIGHHIRAEEIWGTPQVILPRVKVCAVHYPRNVSDANLVKQRILPKIPAIESLKVLYYRPAFMGTDIFGDPFFAAVEVETERFFNREHYWDSCQNLKFIEVHEHGGHSEAVYVSNRPERDAEN
ncbi:unnamed protein product [Orchesella dallaii]|uniref:Uncharacterized protein n=1 Tax=Orchesella dallaii TaxID=48710 RepID=A0ABP1S645_9HEXA